MTPPREPPSAEQLRLNVQAMRDKAEQFKAWRLSVPVGNLRYGLWAAERDLRNAANELDAALNAVSETVPLREPWKAA